ncbi:MAG TPA: hypothetical protein VD770_02685 [Coxiellaceae bacterium]|nr:hypothetical protein [Coxiellaceae bacterium]
MTLFHNKNDVDKILAKVASEARAREPMTALAEAVAHNERKLNHDSQQKEPII